MAPSQDAAETKRSAVREAIGPSTCRSTAAKAMLQPLPAIPAQGSATVDQANSAQVRS
ncbi:hypothetical protein [Mycolicibacterium agri]|uniref:Uncharacterized protein n=1 Tax=Mycolicibacterium agri TaxID=36811 RepID=A0A7I9VZ51_MYCAG|nr:hypothetical protein [Mycolicibacterium agri]GFG50327.1 hypothetical protein MAGR_17680 [Mycolicibacterium agri]